VVDGLPGWELMWHKSPSTAATDYVKDSVEDLAQGVHSRASGSSGDRQMRLYVLPLGVGEVGLVCSSDLMPGILPGQCFRTPFQTVSEGNSRKSIGPCDERTNLASKHLLLVLTTGAVM
jgi:hypothetical protein